MTAMSSRTDLRNSLSASSNARDTFISLEAYSALWEEVLFHTPEYDPKVLRRYAPASKEVYGEVNPVLVSDFIRALKLSSQDILYDLGSGVGNVVMQAAAQTGCTAIGVEIRRELTDIGLALQKNYEALLRKQKLLRGEVRLVCGDILSPDIDISNATVVFLNNYCFPQHLEQNVLKKFKRGLRDGVRIITLKDFAPRFRPTSIRFIKSHCHLFKFPWIKCRSSPDAVSWTDKSVDYFIYEVDRNNLIKQKEFKEALKRGEKISLRDSYQGSSSSPTLPTSPEIGGEKEKAKGNESEENSDVEVRESILSNSESRAESTETLVRILRECRDITHMLTAKGCDTTALEARNKLARVKLQEAGVKALRLSHKKQKTFKSSNSPLPKCAEETDLRSSSPRYDERFEEIEARFAAWQDKASRTRLEFAESLGQAPQKRLIEKIECKLGRWEKEAGAFLKKPPQALFDFNEAIDWEKLDKDFARWQRKRKERDVDSNLSEQESDSDNDIGSPKSKGLHGSESSKLYHAHRGQSSNYTHPLPEGWSRRVRFSSGRRRWQFRAPTGETFLSLKRALEFLEENDTASRSEKQKLNGNGGDESPKKRKLDRKAEESAEEDDSHDDVDDGGGPLGTEQPFMVPHRANGSYPLPKGWTRQKRGRYYSFFGPDGTKYRSLVAVLRALHAQKERDKTGHGVAKHDEVKDNPERSSTAPCEQSSSPSATLSVSETNPTPPARKRIAKRTRCAHLAESSQPAPAQTASDQHDSEGKAVTDLATSTATVTAAAAPEKPLQQQQARESKKKSARARKELDRLRGWDQWREEEAKRKEELIRMIRERRRAQATEST